MPCDSQPSPGLQIDEIDSRQATPLPAARGTKSPPPPPPSSVPAEVRHLPLVPDSTKPNGLAYYGGHAVLAEPMDGNEAQWTAMDGNGA